MLFMVAFYTVTIYLSSLSRIVIEVDLKPFLRIHDEKYCKRETLMRAPVVHAGWILA